MRTQLTLFLIFLFFINPSFTSAQSNPNPEFDTFKGTVYKLPRQKKYKLQYHPRLEKQEVITTLKWDKIDVPETDDRELFPDVGLRYGFSIIFKSNMKIAKEGFYKFSLTSDDGSVLWIGEKAVILNDGIHKMRFVEDSIALSPDTYPIKIWYFQKFPDRFGIQFNSSYYRDMIAGESITPLENPITQQQLKLVIPNQILNFEYDSYEVDASAKIFLDSIANKILTVPNIATLKISGFTDDTGSKIYNSELSIKRAITIQKELAQRIKNPSIKYDVKGYGESRFLYPNDSEENRKKNRRVEIEIVLKDKKE